MGGNYRMINQQIWRADRYRNKNRGWPFGHPLSASLKPLYLDEARGITS